VIATLDQLLRDLARRHGERLAAAGEDGQLTFGKLDRAADGWCDRLRDLGADAGVKVGLLAGNGPQWLAAAFGVWRSGATLVPLSTFGTARELNQTLEHADVEILLLQPRLRSHDYEAMLSRSPRPPALREIVPLEPAPSARGVPDLATPDGIACILYTSGTTGQPKGVMLSHRAILATVAPTAERTGLTPEDALLSTLPLFWVAGLVIRALPTLATGCGLLLTETFTAEGVIALLRRHRTTGLHLRPPQVGQILAHPQFEPALLANVHRGGGRTEWFAPFFDPERVRFITGYGMTETAGYVTALDWRDCEEARRSGLGSPLPGVEIRIVDGEGRECPAGRAGEIHVRAPSLFSGYYKQAAGIGLDGDGFLCTGDLGRVGAGGEFHFDGRSKDLLRVKGINVSPVEVEAVLGAHPAVEAAYVVGLPHDGIDQRVVALIVARDARPSETELRAFAASALSHYKCPERYVFISRADVVLGPTAKPQRAALARLAEKS